MFNNSYLIYYDNNIICSNFNEDDIDLSEWYLKKIERDKNMNILNKDNPIEENNLFNFKITALDKEIKLSIYEGYVYKKELYSINWKEIYSCKLKPMTTKVYEEIGFGDIYFWRDLLLENFNYNFVSNSNDICLNKNNYIEELRKIFPSVAYYENIGKFLNIYLKKGIYVNQKKYDFNQIKKSKVNLFIGKKYNTKKEPIKYCQLKQISIQGDEFFEILLLKGFVIDGKIECKKKEYAFITKNYLYNINISNLNDLFDTELIYGKFYYNKFQEQYPEVMLQEYINSGGKFILPFLLATNHNIIFELISKAGLGYIADRIYLKKELKNNFINFNETNLKKVFGMPIKALKKINSYEFQFEEPINFEFCKLIYNSQPAIFNLSLTRQMMSFIEFEKIRDTEFFSKTIKSKKFIHMLRYISNFTKSEIDLYKDYLIMGRMENLKGFSLEPKNLKLSHDVLMNYMNEKRESIKNSKFIKIVNSDIYQNFIWEKDKYYFLIPRNADDLVNESYQMSNCVRSYVNSVANNYCYIIFLRKNKNKSFITIEVNKDLKLNQAKGKCNTTISKEMAILIIEWCKEKGIDYNCEDIKKGLERW